MSKDEIPLHPTRGLNPSMTKCGYCGEPNGELVMLGYSGRYRCLHCGVLFYAYATSSKKRCPRCNEENAKCVEKPSDVDGTTAVVIGGPCGKCEAQLEKERVEFEAEIERGGIPFKCVNCDTRGIVKHDAENIHDLHESIRLYYEKRGEPIPKKAGITIRECPQCRKEKA